MLFSIILTLIILYFIKSYYYCMRAWFLLKIDGPPAYPVIGNGLLFYNKKPAGNSNHTTTVFVSFLLLKSFEKNTLTFLTKTISEYKNFSTFYGDCLDFNFKFNFQKLLREVFWTKVHYGFFHSFQFTKWGFDRFFHSNDFFFSFVVAINKRSEIVYAPRRSQQCVIFLIEDS